MPEVSDQLLNNILQTGINAKASDIILSAGVTPDMRIDGYLNPIPNMSELTAETVEGFIRSLVNEEQYQRYRVIKELDFSFDYQNTRIRANAYHQRGKPACALRIITNIIRSYDDLNLPPIVRRFAQAKQGFVVITGPTGHGKSTTLATIVEDINQNIGGHIVTIEDPIEYVFEHKKAVISQREIGADTNSFARALKSAVRQDPNVILVGEMRDYETVDTALTLAETGHLVLTTLHTNSAAQTTDRMINMFPPYLQNIARQQIANVMLGIVSQRLINKVGGGRTMAAEIMLATQNIRALIREGKTHQIDNVIATSASDGMISLDKVIAGMITKGDISLEDGLMWASDPKLLKSMLY